MIDLLPRIRRDDGVPSVPALPIVGVLPFLLGREGPVASLVDLASRFASEGLVAVPLPAGETKIFVCDVATAEEVLDDRRWEKAIDPLTRNLRHLVGNGLFTADSEDPDWETAHRILAPSFSFASMARYTPTIVEVLEDTIVRWRRTDGPIDVVNETSRFTLDAIARVGFDRSFGHGGGASGSDPFLDAFASAFDELVARSFRPPLPAPLLARADRRFRRDRASIDRTVDGVISARTARPRASWPDDLLTRMLAASDPRTGRGLDERNIRYQVLTFLLAGHETTATLLAFALHHLARDPGLAARVRDEADRVLADGTPTHAHVASLELTSRVLDETLRLHPPAPFFIRKPRATTRLGGRLVITPEESVAVLLPSIHRDPAVWADPERFDPDRFLPEAVRARPAHAFRPFGHGKRICTGRSFAIVEATLALAMILRAFELGDPGPLSVRGRPVPKPHRFFLHLRPRVRAHVDAA